MPTSLKTRQLLIRREGEKLALLRSMAAEGFNALDQGQGIAIDGEQQLAEFIGRIERALHDRMDLARHLPGDYSLSTVPGTFVPQG